MNIARNTSHVTTAPEQSLAWFPMPGGPQRELPVHDGWRDYGHERRQRVAFDLDRFEKRQKQPYDR